MLKNRLFNNPVIDVLFYTQFSLIFFSSMLVFTTRSMLFFLLIWFFASNQLSTSVPLLGLARGLPILLLAFLGGYIADRFKNHSEYINERIESGKEVKHILNNHDFSCISYQESKILINGISSIENKEDFFEVRYKKLIG